MNADWNNTRVKSKFIIFPKTLVNSKGKLETKMLTIANVKQKFGRTFYGLNNPKNMNDTTHIAGWFDESWA